ncbi:hypothetical protein LQ567_21210 [Niabella pedocola]|uniref:Uncharacterized protein n=1 Tax=Niabella pedocola TaxID=1752077 RepID=A0ABS8PW65_9BACT|nr:hypothetical protein [Niabella pedocola]MCD2425319.1 hypothetical protein [Niabella pedocola]
MSCSKKLEVNENIVFKQVNFSGYGEYSGAMHIELRPDGRAFFYPGGSDIVWSGHYKISGKKLKYEYDAFETGYTFEIVSGTELKGEDGEILKIE